VPGLFKLLSKQFLKKNILKTVKEVKRIEITAYEPAYGIIGDPAKLNPTTRQSADHSMAYIISTLLRKAL